MSYFPADDSLQGCLNTLDFYRTITLNSNHVQTGIPSRLNEGPGAMNPVTPATVDLAFLEQVPVKNTAGRIVDVDAFPLLRTCVNQALFIAAGSANQSALIAEISLLWRQNQALQLHLGVLSDCALQAKAIIETDYEGRIDGLGHTHVAQVEALQNALHSRPATAVAQTHVDFPVKFDHPDTFDGKREELNNFIIQVVQKMTQNPGLFPNPEVKVSYTLSRLRGKALNTCAHAYDKNGDLVLPPIFTTPADIFKVLRLSFGDPHEKKTAETWILEKKMGNRSFTEFLVDFQANARKTSWDHPALISHLYSALNLVLKTRVTDKTPLDSPPTDLHEYIEFVRKCDADARALNLYKSGGHHTTSGSGGPSS